MGGGGVAYSILSFFRGIYTTNASGVEQTNDTSFDQLAIYKPGARFSEVPKTLRTRNQNL